MNHEEFEEEEKRLIASGVMTPPEREMDWEAFWAMPSGKVSDEAVREAVAWAKGDAAMEACFLGFLAADVAKNPQNIRPLDKGLARELGSLVDGVAVSGGEDLGDLP